jgi:hypothetical protein
LNVEVHIPQHLNITISGVQFFDVQQRCHGV